MEQMLHLEDAPQPSKLLLPTSLSQPSMVSLAGLPPGFGAGKWGDPPSPSLAGSRPPRSFSRIGHALENFSQASPQRISRFTAQIILSAVLYLVWM